MDTLTAINVIEGNEEADHDKFIEAYQHLIDTGIIAGLQGSYQRNAQQLIANGWCTPKD